MRLLEELATRIAGNYCEWSDDGNIVYGTLVMLYGDYGVSTRAGWIDGDDLKEDLIDLLGDLRGEELEIRKSREEDN